MPQMEHAPKQRCINFSEELPTPHEGVAHRMAQALAFDFATRESAKQNYHFECLGMLVG